MHRTHTETNLLQPGFSGLNVRRDQHPTNLPAQIEIYAEDGDAYKFLFIAKGGGSANKSFLYQETPARLNKEAMLTFRMRRLGRSDRGLSYHLAVAIGGTSAEFNLKTVSWRRHAISTTCRRKAERLDKPSDMEMEQEILELTRQMGIGAVWRQVFLS